MTSELGPASSNTSRIPTGRPAADTLTRALAFDEGGGVAVKYHSGMGHDGVLTGGSWITTGRFGGALHLVQNNQVGFTTDFEDSRSTQWASDLAKGFDVPIFKMFSDIHKTDHDWRSRILVHGRAISSPCWNRTAAKRPR